MNKNWEYNELNVGLQEMNKKLEFVFILTPEAKAVKNIYPKCDCTNVSQGIKDNKLTIAYTTPKEIAPHLVEMGKTSQYIRKEIIIEYIDGTEETLAIMLNIKNDY